MGCSKEKAEKFAKAYNDGFPGIAEFKKKGSAAVRKNGYILLNPITGHKTYWWDWDKWKAVQDSHDETFWEEYKPIKQKKIRALEEGKPKDYYMDYREKGIMAEVSHHFKAAAKWDRKALNSVTQGTGAICFKEAATRFFHWIVDNGHFGVVMIVDCVHDELCEEHPKSMPEVPNILKEIMESTAAKYCKSVPIPAEPAVGDHWIH